MEIGRRLVLTRACQRQVSIRTAIIVQAYHLQGNIKDSERTIGVASLSRHVRKAQDAEGSSWLSRLSNLTVENYLTGIVLRSDRSKGACLLS